MKRNLPNCLRRGTLRSVILLGAFVALFASSANAAVAPTSTYPANGATISELSEVKLTFSGAFAVTGQPEEFTISYNGDVSAFSAFELDGESEAGSMIIKLDSPITKSGEYVFTIPENSFYVVKMMGGGSTEEITISFTISGSGETTDPEPEPGLTPVAYSEITPAPGNVTEIEEIYIYWGESTLAPGTGNVTLEINGGQPEILENDRRVLVKTGHSTFFPDEPGNVNISYFMNALTAEGTYKFTIPEGFVLIEAENNAPNAKIELEYVIGDGSTTDPEPGITPEPTITPSNNSIVDKIELVEIDWSAMIMDGDNLNTENCIVLKDGAPYDASITPVVDFDDILRLYFDSPITDPGIYTIEIPADYVIFVETGVSNEAFTINYTIEGADTSGVVPSSTTPADGATIAELSEIKITFNGADIVTGYPQDITISKDGVVSAFPAYESDSESEASTVILKLNSPITEPGEYVVTFPAESFTAIIFGSAYDTSAEFTISFTIENDGSTTDPDPDPEDPAEGEAPQSVDPSNGAELDVLSKITLTWNYLQCASGEGTATIEYNGVKEEISADAITFIKGSYTSPSSTVITLNRAEPGEYIITLPAKFIELSTTSYGPKFYSQEVVLKYTVTGGEIAAPEYSVEPASGSEINRLGNVRIQWGSSMLTKGSGDITLKINDAEPVILTDDEVGFYAGSEGMWGGLIPGNPGNITFFFEPSYTEKGTYVITIPAGYVTVNDESALNGEIVLTYYVTGEAFIAPTPSITPEDKSEIESISEIEIDWGIAIVDGNNQGDWYSTIQVLKDGDYYQASPNGYVGFDDVLIIEFKPEITEPGVYTIEIPVDYVRFADYDEPNDAFTITYTIKGNGDTPTPPQGDYTFSPWNTDPLARIPEEVNVYFPDRTQEIIPTGNGEATIKISDNEPVDISDRVTVTYDIVGSGLASAILYFIKIDLSEIEVEEEAYNLLINISQGFFNIGGANLPGGISGGEDSPEINILYVIDKAEAVRGINADSEGVYTVYTLDGVLVLRTENVIDLNSLASGLYIINGKKFIIRN